MRKKKIILASKSNFRKRALDITGVDYKIRPSSIDESKLEDKNPSSRVIELALTKVQEVGQNYDSGSEVLIVGGDLIVEMGGEVFEKPSTKEEARRMLKEFSGSKLSIIASTVALDKYDDDIMTSIESCQISFRKIRESEIEDHIIRFPVSKFAGGFGVNGLARFADKVCGPPLFLTGFSVNDLLSFLEQKNIL